MYQLFLDAEIHVFRVFTKNQVFNIYQLFLPSIFILILTLVQMNTF